MTRARTHFPSVRSEGGLLPLDLLARLHAGDASLAGADSPSFHLNEHERVGEAANRSWSTLRGAWQAFKTAVDGEPETGLATTVTRERWLLPLFQELGYGRLPKTVATEVAGKKFAISHGWHCSPIHLLGCRVDLDKRRRGTAGAAQSSPHGLVQDFLNSSDNHLWGFLSNGLRLRVLRDHYSLTRQAYVEFDLQAIMEGERYSEFVLLWLVCHQSRVEAPEPEQCWVEQWFRVSQSEGIRALDKLRSGVERAIETLGRGFLTHRKNEEIRAALQSGALNKQDYYRQLLRLAYRMIFMFVAEDRDGLLDPKASERTRDRYQNYYSTRRLRRLAERRRGGPHSDLWASLRLVMDGLNEGCPALGLAALGSRLWGPSACPWLTKSECSNEFILSAVRGLSLLQEGRTTYAVNWRNVGAEEMGSVYEGLLELEPQLHLEAGTFELDTASGHERKTTGSYYTPTRLVDALLESVLDPVLAEAAAQGDPEQALLRLKICDPACGSGHFLVAAARRIAKRLATVRSGDDEPSPPELQQALRDVVGQCIYGVDLNPMAVELCKISLWMEAMEPGRPLAFLDSHIQRGNALLGTTTEHMQRGIPDAAFKPMEGDDVAVAKRLKRRNKDERSGQITMSSSFAPSSARRGIVGQFIECDSTPDLDLAGVKQREQCWRTLSLSASFKRAWSQADAWCASFVWPKTAGELEHSAITEGLWRKIANAPDEAPQICHDTITQLARTYQFFHWEQAFPSVFQDPARSEGFDAVIGNPPWGQKEITELTAPKNFVRARYDSLAGIHDYFRPFVELATEICRDDGSFGFVLPDTLLLKNYEPTRELLLTRSRIQRIDWWGMAFKDATIDTITIACHRAKPASDHRVEVAIHDPDAPLSHSIPQPVFENNERKTFNLYLTEENRKFLEQFADCPRLEEYFEVHEGVHSGNIRKELFVDSEIDESCKRLIFGRGDLGRYRVSWSGKYIRLSVVPAKKTKKRYANVGKPAWHDGAKVLVRRTGDSVQAAADHEGLYASNNFFVVLASKASALTLDGLTALLNSDLITRYFRVIEPRKGRAFAELKIKHLNRFPLPRSLDDKDSLSELHGLGKKRREIGTQTASASDGQGDGQEKLQQLERRIDAVVAGLFGIAPTMTVPTVAEPATPNLSEVAR